MRYRGVLLLLFSAVFGVTLAGCSGGGNPPAPTTGTSEGTGSPSTSVEPTPPASQTATAPTADPNIPGAAKANTPESAQEFATYFIAQLNKSWQIPDPTLLPPLSTPECTTCSAVIGTAQQYADLGQHYKGTPISVSSVVLSSFSTSEGAVVLVFGEQEAASVVDSYGSTIRSVNASKANLALTMSYSDGWRVTKGQALGTPS